ncbi:amino acid ABC transporter substrate-binding protein [Carboxydochorda subterranea]|uniref:Amino acid ABC transporter substrate-binding protein n=1 Tax=Carboxydichorda subterranea TaxID=3109565 RepID=A0ABZ1BXF9_9FIRM|nr:amino acid ABC transporter substrate-binding protein [Limnochorda sp. L945t]WRP17393.1 amino acid ABC transporter substrate-binding protein [Limnochorda sp. L945t]
MERGAHNRLVSVAMGMLLGAAAMAVHASIAVAATPIRIGATLPLTGPFADTGQWVARGYQKWARDVNARGGLLGRPVELTILDDASVADRAISLLERLITVDRVDLILGGYPGTAAAAQMAVAERYRKVYVSMGGHMASFQRGFRYSFGAPPLMGEWWYEGVWEWLATLPAAQRPQKAAMITINNPVGAAVRSSAIEGLRRVGILLVMDERYDVPLATAEPLVSRAIALGADLFIANGFFPDGVQTIRAMKALNYNPKLVLQGIGSIIPEWVQELGADGNYVVSGTPLHDRLPFAGIAELAEAARQEFGVGTTPQYYLFGYAWAQALEKGVQGAGTLDQDAVAAYLRSHIIETIAGRFTFDARGLPPPYRYTTQVIEGRVELIWPPEVATHAPVYPKPSWGK